MAYCEMKGFLSFLILWILSKEKKSGSEIADELSERKGSRPSPGTIYPALKFLKDKGLIKDDSKKRYSLTAKGKKELQDSLSAFMQTFPDIDEMRDCCRKR